MAYNVSMSTSAAKNWNKQIYDKNKTIDHEIGTITKKEIYISYDLPSKTAVILSSNDENFTNSAILRGFIFHLPIVVLSSMV